MQWGQILSWPWLLSTKVEWDDDNDNDNVRIMIIEESRGFVFIALDAYVFTRFGENKITEDYSVLASLRRLRTLGVWSLHYSERKVGGRAIVTLSILVRKTTRFYQDPTNSLLLIIERWKFDIIVSSYQSSSFLYFLSFLLSRIVRTWRWIHTCYFSGNSYGHSVIAYLRPDLFFFDDVMILYPSLLSHFNVWDL